MTCIQSEGLVHRFPQHRGTAGTYWPPLCGLGYVGNILMNDTIIVLMILFYKIYPRITENLIKIDKYIVCVRYEIRFLLEGI